MRREEKPKAEAIFNNEAMRSLREALFQALETASVYGRFVDAKSESFSRFRRICTKYFGNWIGEDDVTTIVWREVYPAIPESPAKGLLDQPRALADLIDKGKRDELAEAILQTVTSLPRRYDVLFPLPNMEVVDRDIVLSDKVALVCARRTNAFSQGPLVQPTGLGGLLSGGATTKSSCCMYLKATVDGYIFGERTQTGMREAQSILKRTVQIGVIKNVFERQWVPPFASYIGSASQDILKAYVYDITAGNGQPTLIQLGLGMSAYLNDLVLKKNLWREVTQKPDEINRSDEVKQSLSFPVQLLTSPGEPGHSESLGSAFEWGFDAAADDELTASCIKTCIALEAALGEESDEGGITERLADRFAFLIGNTTADRGVFRAKMRNVYRLRSKLVHGKKVALSHEDHRYATEAPLLLEMALRTELTALEKWAAKKDAGQA